MFIIGAVGGGTRSVVNDGVGGVGAGHELLGRRRRGGGGVWTRNLDLGTLFSAGNRRLGVRGRGSAHRGRDVRSFRKSAVLGAKRGQDPRRGQQNIDGVRAGHELGPAWDGSNTTAGAEIFPF